LAGDGNGIICRKSMQEESDGNVPLIINSQENIRNYSRVTLFSCYIKIISGMFLRLKKNYNI